MFVSDYTYDYFLCSYAEFQTIGFIVLARAFEIRVSIPKSPKSKPETRQKVHIPILAKDDTRMV